MKKLKLSLIANERSRKATFMKRKKGIKKKLHELTTLCGVQACAVIYSPYQSIPESWPSKEGVKEVNSKFMEMQKIERTKKMMDQKTYLQERIAKVEKKVSNLILENRELQIKQFMFDCIEGKMSTYRYDARDLHDLQCYIQNYIDLLTPRIEIFTENGESSSFLQDMNLDSNHNLNLNLNLNSIQYPSQQHIGYVGGHASIPSMDGNPYNNHQLPNGCPATISHMPSTNTTNGVYPLYTNNSI